MRFRAPTVAVLLLAVLAVPARALPARSAQSDGDVPRAIEAWLDAWRRGKLDAGSNADVRGSLPRAFDALPKGVLGRLTMRRVLEVLLETAVEDDSAEVARVVLQVAGARDEGAPPERLPLLVAALGEQALQKLESPAAVELLTGAAAGKVSGPRGTAPAFRAAALRELGRRKAEGAGELLRAALAATEAPVRTGAANGLEALGDVAAVEPLAAVLAKEREPVPLRACARALTVLLAEPAVAAGPRGQAAESAIAALGRADWRADADLVALLESARDARAVPALIDLLQRFADDKRAVRSGALSGVLLHDAHDALVSLTGATLPAEEPARWREWWTANASEFRVAERATRADGATTSGFFGIPVHGTRVVFVVDLSYSMNAPMPATGTTTPGGRQPTRLEVAREEVWKAASKLDDNAMLNVVVFSREARTWQKKLVPATAANKRKLRTFLDELEVEPATNLWSGLQVALEFEPGSLATRDELQIDELFVLSDGAPTVGEITDEREILNVVTEANRYKEIRINTIFLEGEGSHMDPAPDDFGPKELMEALARRNGGTFVHR